MPSHSKRYNFGKEGISVDFFHKLTANFGNQLLIREKWANKIVLEIFAQVPINFASSYSPHLSSFSKLANFSKLFPNQNRNQQVIRAFYNSLCSSQYSRKLKNCIFATDIAK